MDIYERKLMLVDDNQELLEMIADILRHSGYKNIVKAKCVQEALTVFQMEKPDMAVLDVMLPDGDGFQLFQKLRENSEIPILFLSARDEDRDRLFGWVWELTIILPNHFCRRSWCLELLPY